MNALGVTSKQGSPVRQFGGANLCGGKFFQRFPGIRTRFDGRFAIKDIVDARATLSLIARAVIPEGSEGAEGSLNDVCCPRRPSSFLPDSPDGLLVLAG